MPLLGFFISILTAIRNASCPAKPMGKTYTNLLKMKYNLASPISINQLDISSHKPTSWVLKRSASLLEPFPSDQLNTQGLSKTAKAERIVPKLSSAHALKVAKTLEDLSESGKSGLATSPSINWGVLKRDEML